MAFETATYDSRVLRTDSRALAEFLASDTAVHQPDTAASALTVAIVEARTASPSAETLLRQYTEKFQAAPPTAAELLDAVDTVAATERRYEALTRFGRILTAGVTKNRDEAAQDALHRALAALNSKYVELIESLRSLDVREADADPVAALDAGRVEQAQALRSAAKDWADLWQGALDCWSELNLLRAPGDVRGIVAYVVIENAADLCEAIGFLAWGKPVRNVASGEEHWTLPWPDPVNEPAGFLGWLAEHPEAIARLADADSVREASRLADMFSRDVAAMGRRTMRFKVSRHRTAWGQVFQKATGIEHRDGTAVGEWERLLETERLTIGTAP